MAISEYYICVQKCERNRSKIALFRKKERKTFIYALQVTTKQTLVTAYSAYYELQVTLKQNSDKCPGNCLQYLLHRL